MSLSSSECDEFYARMSRLELKLKESEEERLELEEKFNRLLHTCKSKQTMQLQQLRNCYRQLLDQDRLRCERNDTILRTLHRIEDRASSLTAKTDRLRLLKKHFETSIDNTYQDRKRSSSVNCPSPRSFVSDVTSTLQPTSYSPRPPESSPLLLIPRTPTISRRSSLVVPDSELLELSKYKLSNESNKRRLFDDSMTSKLPTFGEILSVENEFIYGSSDSKPTTEMNNDYNFSSSYSKPNIGKHALQGTTLNVENIGVQKNKEKFISENCDSVKKNSFIKKYELPNQSVVPENSLITRFPSKVISARPLTKSTSFNATQKYITYPTPEKYSLNRRPSFISHRGISSPESIRSHSPLSSKSPHLAYSRTKSPLGVVDDIFKKYLINYDKRYLSDPISESKYGKYLYPSRCHDNESFRNSSAIVNRSSISREKCVDHDKNDKYFDSTFLTSRLSNQYKRYGSGESLYSVMPKYQSSDLLNYPSQSSYSRSDWKEWNHFRGRYQYLPKVGTDEVQSNSNYLDDLDVPNYSGTRNDELNPILSYDFNGDFTIKDKPYLSKENNDRIMLNKENESSAFKYILEKPFKNTHDERDIGQNCINHKTHDYEFKQKDNYAKMPPTPKRVSFSNKFRYDDKSDTDISLSPEEDTKIIEDNITSQIQQHPEKEFLQPQLGSKAAEQGKSILSGSNLIKDHLTSSETKSSGSNRDIIRYETDPDIHVLNSVPFLENKDIDKSDLHLCVSGENEQSENIFTGEGGQDSIPNSEEFKTRTKRRASLFPKDELIDNSEDSTTKSNIKEHSDVQSLKELANSEDLSGMGSGDKQVENDSLFSKSGTNNKEYYKDKNILKNIVEDGISIGSDIEKNMLKNYSEVESGQDKNICDVDEVPTSLKEREIINKQESKEELDKMEQYDTKIKQSFEVKQYNDIIEEKIADSSQNRSDITVDKEYSEKYQPLPGDTKYQSHPNGSLSEDKPAPTFEEECNDTHYSPTQRQYQQYEQQQEGFTGDSYTDQNVTMYQQPRQDDQYPQEHHQQPEIYEGEFYKQPEVYEGEFPQQPLDYNVHNYSQDDSQAYQTQYPEQYQTNEYVEQDQYGQAYVEKGRDTYSPNYYQQNPTEKEYPNTQLERGHPNEYSQQPVRYDDNYQEPSHDDQRLYESDYEAPFAKDPQYQYDQQKEIYGQANIPEQYEEEYKGQRSQQIREQYESDPSQYDTQVSDQFNQQYQNQQITEQYGNQYEDQPNQYDAQLKDQYDQQYQNQHRQQIAEQYKNQPDQYDTQIADQYDQQTTDQYEGQSNQYETQVPAHYDTQMAGQYDQQTTEQYDKQYEGQSNRYNTQVPAHYDTQMADQYDQQTSEQYERQSNQYDTQVPAHYDTQMADQYDQQTVEQYGQSNQYDTQVPTHYDTQMADQYDQQTTEQYEGQSNRYDTQVPTHYDTQMTDQYDQRIREQYKGQYERQSSQYDTQVPDQYDEQYQEQYDHQTTDQYQDPQYQGQLQYEGLEEDKYNEEYQLQPDQYQRTDQYEEQYPNQFDQQYQNQPDQYEQQYSGYKQQTQNQYDDNYQAQPDQYEYKQQHLEQHELQQTPDQFNELYQGEPVQHDYDGQQKPSLEQQSYSFDTQYQGDLQHPNEAAVKEIENLSYGSSERISQETNKSIPANKSSPDQLLPNTNQGANANNASVQPASTLKPKTSEKTSPKATPDLNRVLESDSESLHTRGPVSQDDSSEFDFSLGKK